LDDRLAQGFWTWAFRALIGHYIKRRTDMTRRIAAITLIFAMTSVAWMFLGVKTSSRTFDYDSRLKGKVAGLWGTQQVQVAPRITYLYNEDHEKKETVVENKRETVRTVRETVTVEKELDIQSSDVDVDLALEHRKKGLLWYNLYKVGFNGRYTAANGAYPDGWFRVTFPFPGCNAVYDDFVFRVNGKDVEFDKNAISDPSNKGAVIYTVAARTGDSIELVTGYKSQGMDNWQYRFGEGSVNRIKDFTLNMKTDFDDIDFPDNTLSATKKLKTAGGWDLTWGYKNLISGYSLGMLMPTKINPGPLASSISYFAPVSLLFFFAFIFIVSTIKDIKIHPMNYFFLAAAFFAFHLLFSYTVDHINIYIAFAMSSFVSVFLVVNYLRLVVNRAFAVTYAGISQLIYLVFFSYAFFLDGFTGLTVTIGAIITLFVLMQITGKVDWHEKFKNNAPKKVDDKHTPRQTYQPPSGENA